MCSRLDLCNYESFETIEILVTNKSDLKLICRIDKNWLFWRQPWSLSTLQGVQGPTVGEWIRLELMLSWLPSGWWFLCILLVYSNPWGRPVPDLEIRNFKLSCLNNWFLARTRLSKLLSLPPSPPFVGCLGFQRGLRGPREVF